MSDGPICEPHAHPVNGGWDGYRAACHECDLSGKLTDDKDEARDEAFAYAKAQCPHWIS